MKKLYALLFLLFLVACDGMSGESHITCNNVAGSLAGPHVGETVVRVQGYDEDILSWRIETTLTRAEFDHEFLHGMYLSNDEIHELFEMYNRSEVAGITFYISELSNNYVVIAKIYDYSAISIPDLNRIWGIDDFEDAVTLSSAIAGLEDQGAVCRMDDSEEEVE